jgi:hypothetical protein
MVNDEVESTKHTRAARFRSHVPISMRIKQRERERTAIDSLIVHTNGEIPLWPVNKKGQLSLP